MKMVLNQMTDRDLGSGTFGKSHGFLKNGVAFGIESDGDSGGFGHGVMVLRKKVSIRTRRRRPSRVASSPLNSSLSFISEIRSH